MYTLNWAEVITLSRSMQLPNALNTPDVLPGLCQESFRGKVFRWFSVYWQLVFIRWANIRNEWYFHLIVGALYPLAILVAFRMLGAVNDPASAMYVAAGNGIVALIMGPMQSLANDLAWGRQRNDLEYYAVLPFSKTQLVLAFVTVASIFSMPAMLITLWVGGLWLKYTIYITPWVVAVMVLSGLSMAGLGVFIGVQARNGHHANMMNSLVMVVVMFFSPVLIPFENLPRVLRFTSKLFPSSYAADAFRAALAGRSDVAVWGNVLALVGFAILLLWWATRNLDWRAE